MAGSTSSSLPAPLLLLRLLRLSYPRPSVLARRLSGRAHSIASCICSSVRCVCGRARTTPWGTAVLAVRDTCCQPNCRWTSTGRGLLLRTVADCALCPAVCDAAQRRYLLSAWRTVREGEHASGRHGPGEHWSIADGGQAVCLLGCGFVTACPSLEPIRSVPQCWTTAGPLCQLAAVLNSLVSVWMLPLFFTLLASTAAFAGFSVPASTSGAIRQPSQLSVSTPSVRSSGVRALHCLYASCAIMYQ